MRRVYIRILLLFVVPVAALLWGAHIYVASIRYVTTENAYVKATVVSISAEVSGRVDRVLVRQNNRVKPGEQLFTIDAEPFRIAFHKSEAELARVRNEIEALKADFRQSRIERREAQQNIDYYQRVFARQKALSKRGHSTRARFDEAQRNLAVSRQRVGALRQNSLRILAHLGGSIDTPAEAHPDYLRAKANRDDAELNLRRTSIHAPSAGIIGPVRIEVGEFVDAGRPLMPLVIAESPWIEANLKETQLTHVRVGQKVEITVDAYPGRTISATVQSISPSTGAELAILPPQNASGNWVKVVQRVPVRLALASDRPPLPLRTGMTVSISIDTERDSSLFELIGTAFAWKAAKE